MSYYLAPSLTTLYIDEINQRWPNRDRRSDGWIGDPSHSARVSDHNPDYSAGGVVRAVDIDVDGISVRQLLNEVIGDPRVWYVIYNRIIYSRTYDWAARRYTGSNPHTSHVHISIRHTKAAENETTAWFGPKQPRRTRGLPVVDLSNVQRQHDRGGTKAHAGVKKIQRALNARYGAGLKVDGWYGPTTGQAWLRHERELRIKKPNNRPHLHPLRNLGRGRFRVVA